MAGFTDRVSQGILNHIVGKTAIFTLPTAYVGLFTAVGTDAGTGFTEVSGGSYARATTAAGDWNAASGTGPSQISNANPINFPSATAGWGSIIALGVFDAVSGGNLLAWDYFGNYQWVPATVNVGSPGVFQSHAHGFIAGDIILWSIENGGFTPTFGAGSFTGQLVVVGPTTDTFTVTNGGVAVNTTATGNGSIRKMTPQTINSGTSSSFPAGALTIRSS
jgi:hypothetical protein